MASTPRKPAKTKVDTTAVGSVFAAAVRGGFAACQIVGRKPGMLLIAALDHYGETVPTLAAVSPAKPLLVTHHFWRGKPHALWVGARVPRDWRYLGKLPAAKVGAIGSHGHADAVPFQAPLQWHWDHRIPADARTRYEATKALAGEEIVIEIGRAPARIARASSEIAIGPGKEIDIPLEQAVDWHALDPLGCLSEVDYAGTDAGVLGLLERAPIIRSLSWQQHGQSQIDVRALDLDQLILDQSGPLTLFAERLSSLTILGAGAGLVVKMRDASSLHLRASGTQAPTLPIAGLESLGYKLELQHFREIDFAQIAKHASIVDLEIFSSPRTRFDNVASLAKLGSLKKLEIREGYGLDTDALKGATLPPTLEHVVIRGYTTDHEPAIRAVFGGVARFELTMGKDVEWLSATLLTGATPRPVARCASSCARPAARLCSSARPTSQW